MYISPSSTLTMQLQDAFQFTDHDLAYNRSGRLSPEQTNRLVGFKHRLTFQLSALLGIVWVFVVVFIKYPDPEPLFMTSFFILTLIIALVARTMYLTSEIRQGHVLRISGTVQHKIESSEDGDFYSLLLEGQRFYVTKHAYELIEAERQYTLYCTKQLEIVSIEPL